MNLRQGTAPHHAEPIGKQPGEHKVPGANESNLKDRP